VVFAAPSAARLEGTVALGIDETNFLKATPESPTPYVTTVGFKSYLPFFYTRPQPPQDSTYYLQGDFLEVRHWLRWQAPHPDSTYFLAKAPLNQDLLADPYMKLIQDTAGYGLFRQLARPAAQE